MTEHYILTIDRDEATEVSVASKTGERILFESSILVNPTAAEGCASLLRAAGATSVLTKCFLATDDHSIDVVAFLIDDLVLEDILPSVTAFVGICCDFYAYGKYDLDEISEITDNPDARAHLRELTGTVFSQADFELLRQLCDSDTETRVAPEFLNKLSATSTFF